MRYGPQEGFHAFYCKLSQESMTGEVIGYWKEVPAAVLLKVHVVKQSPKNYANIHRWGLLSTLAKEIYSFIGLT